jgi:sterol desaturase/sphingolipid hydroxylase (fatty acid hydroxylase superfamily)
MSRGPNYIALAIPFFFVLILVELFIERRRKRAWYRFSDAVTNIGCGVTSQVVNLFFRGALLWGYVWVYENHRLIDLSSSPVVAWTIAFVGVDFLYYWWHRASHEVNLLWAAHIVHHQSDDYNFAVALRQAVLTAYTMAPFYLPLALLGVPPLLYGVSVSISTLYQFWIHTEAIRKLGPLELVLNTPSHHRVHHARNPAYLDKNYGAILIIWDRLFGSFAEEIERPVYGITSPIRSFNPMWAQVHALIDLAERSARAPRLADKLKVWIMPPAWLAQGEAPKPHADLDVRYEVPVPPSLKGYVTVNFTLIALATFGLLLGQDTLPLRDQIGIAFLVLLALPAWGALFEGKRWGLPLELSRLALTAAAVAAWALEHERALPSVAMASVAGAVVLGLWAIWLPKAPAPRDTPLDDKVWRFAP